MKLLAIIGLTLRELRASKLIILPLTVAIAFALVAANIDNPGAWGDKLLTASWTALAAAGSLVGILAASSLVSSEIERGTMLLLGSRPVGRSTIVLGKALGMAIYLAICALAWALVFAVGLGSNMEQGFATSFLGALLAYPAMLLGAALALTASTLFPTRGAIGAALSIWLAAAIVMSIPLGAVKAANRDRVSIAQDVLGWLLPNGRFAELRDGVLGAPVAGDAYLALVVPLAWTLVAVVILATRRSLAR